MDQGTTSALEALAVLQRYFSSEDAIEMQSAISPSRRTYAALAQEHLALRELRRRLFGVEMSSEYCWEMLVTLYLAHFSGTRLSVTDISHTTGIPVATTVRWLAVLTSHSMITRTADPADGRRTWIGLRGEAVKRLNTFFQRQQGKNFNVTHDVERAA